MLSVTVLYVLALFCTSVYGDGDSTVPLALSISVLQSTTMAPNSTQSMNTTIAPNSTQSTNATIAPNSTQSTNTTISPNSTQSTNATVAPTSILVTNSTVTTISTQTITNTTVSLGPVPISTPEANPSTVSTSVSPTTVKAPAATTLASGSRFDAGSFVGGMVLAIGLIVIGVVGYKCYQRRRGGRSYQTL